MALVSDLRRTDSAIHVEIGVGRWRAMLAVCCAAAITVAMTVAAAGQTAPNTSSPGTVSASSSKHPVHGKTSKAKPAPVETVATPAPSQPMPNWPANDKAVAPSVSWNGRNLTIAATNSSLQQILTEVSTATGVKVEGETDDQRIFGSYGPAPAWDVLNQLLDGTGYNVLIIGDKGEGTPRELVLTAKTHVAPSGSGANAQARQSTEDEAPEEPEPQQPEQPNNLNQRRPFGLQPGQGRTPEQIQREMQQRQQQLEQQPQLQPQVPPQPQPPNN